MTNDPFSPIRLSIDLDREIEAAFSQLIHQPWGRCGTLPNWQPAVDVIETEDAYHIEADLPGVTRQDIEIEAGERRLELRGHRRSVRLSQTGREVRLERSHGEFQRTISFEHPVDPDQMESRCDAGILHVRLPKRRSESVS